MTHNRPPSQKGASGIPGAILGIGLLILLAVVLGSWSRAQRTANKDLSSSPLIKPTEMKSQQVPSSTPFIHRGRSYGPPTKHMFLDQFFITIPELVDSSDAVITGEVTQALPAQTTVDKTTGGWLVTSGYQISVEKYLKADGQDNVIVRVLGGQAEGYTLEVSGEAKLSVGEKVLLFLRRKSADFELDDNEFVVTAGERGKYTLQGGEALSQNGRSTLPLQSLVQQIKAARDAGWLSLRFQILRAYLKKYSL